MLECDARVRNTRRSPINVLFPVEPQLLGVAVAVAPHVFVVVHPVLPSGSSLFPLVVVLSPRAPETLERACLRGSLIRGQASSRKQTGVKVQTVARTTRWGGADDRVRKVAGFTT